MEKKSSNYSAYSKKNHLTPINRVPRGTNKQEKKLILKRTLIKHQQFLCTPPPPPTHTLFPNSRAIWSQTASSVMPALHNAHTQVIVPLFCFPPRCYPSITPLLFRLFQSRTCSSTSHCGQASSRHLRGQLCCLAAPLSLPKALLCPPSLGLKRCSSIFNGAIVLLCVSE